MVKGKAWLGIKDPPAGEGQVGQKQHCRAVTSLALLERARAWEWIKDPPAGEGQVGQKHLFGKGGTGWIEKPDGVDRRLHDDAGISASGRRKDYVAM